MLKYQIDASEAQGLDEATQSLYEQKGDNFVLKVEGVPQEDVSGLKRKVDELLNEKKAAQAKALEAQEQAKREAEEKLKKANDFEQLYSSSEAEREKAAQELAELKAQIQQQNVNSKAAEVATQLTKDTARAKLLTEQIQSRLSLVDGEVRVLDQNGNLTVSTVEELTASIKAEYPFLVDGSQAAGGGAIGSSSGAGTSKLMTRADFDALPNNKRAEFIKGGGKLTE
jgi:flagellar biosynthesis GTPase FlhF